MADTDLPSVRTRLRAAVATLVEHDVVGGIDEATLEETVEEHESEWGTRLEARAEDVGVEEAVSDVVFSLLLEEEVAFVDDPESIGGYRDPASYPSLFEKAVDVTGGLLDGLEWRIDGDWDAGEDARLTVEFEGQTFTETFAHMGRSVDIASFYALMNSVVRRATGDPRRFYSTPYSYCDAVFLTRGQSDVVDGVLGEPNSWNVRVRVRSGLAELVDRGVLDAADRQVLDDVVESYESDGERSLGQRVADVGPERVAADLLCDYLEAAGVVFSGDPECIYGYGTARGYPRLFDEHVALTGGLLDGLDYEVAGDWSAGEDASVTVRFDGRTFEETFEYSGMSVDVASFYRLLNRVVEEKTDDPRRFHPLPDAAFSAAFVTGEGADVIEELTSYPEPESSGADPEARPDRRGSGHEATSGGGSDPGGGSDDVDATPTVAWRIELDGNVEGPAVAEGVIVAGANTDGQWRGFDAATGEQLWTFQTDFYLWAGPAVNDGVVYAPSFDNHLYALDLETGTEWWRFRTRGGETTGTGELVDEGFRSPQAGRPTVYNALRGEGKIRTVPTVDDGTVYFGSDDRHVYAVDAAEGTERWAFETGDAIWGSPAVADGVVYGPSTDGNCYAIDAATGEELAARPVGELYGRPAVGDEAVYLGRSTGERDDDHGLVAVDPDTLAERWSADTGGSLDGPLVLRDGVVYGTSGGNALVAVDTDGTKLWATDVGPRSECPPVVTERRVYAGSMEGFHAFDRATGEERWCFETGDKVNGWCVAGDTAYLGTFDDELIALALEGAPE